MSPLSLATPLIALLTLLCVCSSAQQLPFMEPSSSQPFTTSFDELAQDVLDEWHIAGLAIGVVRGDETWTKGYGYANLDTKEPVTSHTLFHSASTTKAFTAALVALLVQDEDDFKDVAWTSKLHDLIPQDFVLMDKYASDETTLQDALSHRTGMPRHDLAWVGTNASISDIVKAMRHFPSSKPFRTTYQYCNNMFSAALHTVVKLTGKSSSSLYHDWLHKPLGMEETFTELPAALECHKTNPACIHSRQYTWSSKTKPAMQELPLGQLSPMTGAGGMISNVNDFTKWIRVLMNEAEPLTKASHRAMRAPLIGISIEPEDFTDPTDGPNWYGQGLVGTTYRGHRLISHDGAISGFHSRVAFFPDLKFGFTIMQNAPNFGFHELAWRLIDDFLDVPKNERVDVRAKLYKLADEMKEKTEKRPRELFPNVAEPPKLAALPIADYAGTYHHPGYGNMTLKVEDPSPAYDFNPLDFDKPLGQALHFKPRLLESFYRFHHVSGEHWLVEDHQYDFRDASLPTGYTKARSEIGPNGRVTAMHVIFETAVEGDEGWLTFSRID